MTISDRVIRYLVCHKQPQDRLEAYGEVSLDSHIIEDGKIINYDQLSFILKNLIKEKKWKHRKIVFCVPDSFVTMRRETVPNQLTKQEAKDYIKLELEGSIRLPFKHPVLDFEVIEHGEEENEILLFAYPKERLDPFVTLFESLTLKPTIADISFLSLYRTYIERDQHTRDEHLLMIQWNKEDLLLTVFHQHQPIFNRHIHFNASFQLWKKDPNGNKVIWNQSTEALYEFIDEQLLTIDRFMDFYQYSIREGNEEVTNLSLSGDFPHMDVVMNSLTDRFELPVKLIKLQDPLSIEYAILYGLAIKGSTRLD